MIRKDTQSKAAERLHWLCGREVDVKMAYTQVDERHPEGFRAAYEDVLCLGREYFFVFKVEGRRRLVRTSSVVELMEVEPS